MWIHSFCQPTVYEDLRVVSWGTGASPRRPLRAWLPSGPPRKPGVSRETSGDRSITRRPDSRLVTRSPGLDALPRLRPRLRETPGGRGPYPSSRSHPARASTSDAPANSPGSADTSGESTTALPRRLPVHRPCPHININNRGQTRLTPQLASSYTCLCIHRGLRPPHLAGVSPTLHTGLHSRTVHQAPPSGPFYSDEAQHSTTPLTSALAHADDRPARTPRPHHGSSSALAPHSLHVTDREQG